MDNKVKQLLDAAALVRDATGADENTAMKVGRLFVSIISAYQAAVAAASTANDGYMTIAHANAIKSANDYISLTAIPTFSAISTKMAEHEQSLASLASSILDNQGKTTTNTAALTAHAARLDTLEVHNVPATQQQDGYMTQQMVFDLEATNVAIEQLSNSTLTGEADYYDYSLVLTLGQFGSKVLPLPVHGGDDGFTALTSPALIDPEAFSYLTDYAQNMDNLHHTLDYLPTTFHHVVAVEPSKVNHSGTLESGVVVYDENSHKFLLEVSSFPGVAGGIYYDAADKYPMVGKFATPGRIYFSADNKTYIAIVGGMVEVKKGSGGDVPVPPQPQTEVLTGGGADESVFCGVIGGGGADDSYFA